MDDKKNTHGARAEKSATLNTNLHDLAINTSTSGPQLGQVYINQHKTLNIAKMPTLHVIV
jgi:hypothetical protein